MPKVNAQTQRYIVRALVPCSDGSFDLKEWTASSFEHIQSLHPSFAEIPLSWFRHSVHYRDDKGLVKGRPGKRRNPKPIYIERTNWVRTTQSE